MARTTRRVLSSTLLVFATSLSVACKQTRVQLLLPGVERPVEVLTHELGVPHIYASSDHDVFFLQGYVHARDRFFQMDANRRAASGTWQS